jgi:hypothetical protein
MLKKAASVVLASLKGSTYRQEYASPFRSLRPCWTTFLNIPRGHVWTVTDLAAAVLRGFQNRFSTTN